MLALGVAACSLTGAKAEASIGASAAVAWGDKRNADANASAADTRQAALTTDMSTRLKDCGPQPHCATRPST